METPPHSRYQFGPFTLDLGSAELRKGSERRPLRPKCFDLLVYLIQHRGKLATKDELLEKIWSDAVVSEATLTRTVGSLRNALDDRADHPSFIETVSRRGYKFIGEVLEAEENVPVSSPSSRFFLLHRAREYPLHIGEQVIGRGAGADILLLTSATSRRHARITLSKDRVTLEDLSSRHGTFVNGKQIDRQVVLTAGDEIRIGGERLVFWSPASETATGPLDSQFP
jgi:DNA-binding winged helix-turn-helix (wHTH) protein